MNNFTVNEFKEFLNKKPKYEELKIPYEMTKKGLIKASGLDRSFILWITTNTNFKDNKFITLKELESLFTNYTGNSCYRLCIPYLNTYKEYINENFNISKFTKEEQVYIKLAEKRINILDKLSKYLKVYLEIKGISLSNYKDDKWRYEFNNLFIQDDYDKEHVKDEIAQKQLLHSDTHVNRYNSGLIESDLDMEIIAESLKIIEILTKKQIFILLEAKGLPLMLNNYISAYYQGYDNKSLGISLKAFNERILNMLLDKETQEFIKHGNNDRKIFGEDINSYNDFIDTYKSILHDLDILDTEYLKKLNFDEKDIKYIQQEVIEVISFYEDMEDQEGDEIESSELCEACEVE